jgi:hypothetical protein
MPSTYTLISSNVLSSSAASVTFSAIPSTYTDLVFRISARGQRAIYIDTLKIQFNSDSGTNYSSRLITGTGTSASSFGNANETSLALNPIVGDGATANTFSSTEIYIPNYNSTGSKPLSVITHTENNSANDYYMRALANLYRGSSGISSVVFTPEIGPNFVAGSSFYLYGIKNS